MTTEPDLPAIVRAWLRDSDSCLPANPTLLDPVLVRLPTTPQRGRWWSPLPMLAARSGAMRRPRVSLTSFVGVGLIVAIVALGIGFLLSAVPRSGSTGPGAAPVETLRAHEEVQVTLGIYSGRADPAWVLTAEETAVLDRIIAALPTVAGEPPAGGLGYHGFGITRSDGTWTAYLGTLAVPAGDMATYRVDEERLVERYLLDTGRPHLDDEEVAAVLESLASVP